MYQYLEVLALAMLPAFILMEIAFGRSRTHPPAEGPQKTLLGGIAYNAPKLWRLNGLIVTILAVWLSFQVTEFWVTLTKNFQIFDLSSFPPLAGFIASVFIYEWFHYAYHRFIAHGNDKGWRFAHQMHHAAESLDAFGANFLHPLDVFAFTTIGVLVTIPLLGLSLESALLLNFWLVFNAMFQHANVATPRWIGFLIQRPESHAIHHRRGAHKYNYANLPLIDLLLGTLRNPSARELRNSEHKIGFYNGASSRWFEMLVGIDVSQPAEKPSTLIHQGNEIA